MRRSKSPLAVDWDQADEADLVGDLVIETDEEECVVIKRTTHEKFRISIIVEVKAVDADIAEDAVSDMISEAMEKLGENYAPDAVVVDFYLDDIEPAEL